VPPFRRCSSPSGCRRRHTSPIQDPWSVGGEGLRSFYPRVRRRHPWCRSNGFLKTWSLSLLSVFIVEKIPLIRINPHLTVNNPPPIPGCHSPSLEGVCYQILKSKNLCNSEETIYHQILESKTLRKGKYRYRLVPVPGTKLNIDMKKTI
jgi:hypothetical protein